MVLKSIDGGGEKDPVMEKLRELRKAAENYKKIADEHAAFMRTQYEALRKAGFTEQQALELMKKG